MTWPDKVSVYHRLTRDPTITLSDSLFEQEVMILSERHQRPAARGMEENVLFDYRIQQKTAEPPVFFLRQFQRTWEMQEETKRRWSREVSSIEDAIRKLEKDSWDRPDAVEDIGSAQR